MSILPVFIQSFLFFRTFFEYLDEIDTFIARNLKMYAMKKTAFQDYLPFIFLALIAIIGMFYPTAANFVDDAGKYNVGDVAWILVASSLVFLMTPGLSFFYGGMVNRKNVINTMMQSFIATGLISVLWVVVGFSLAFGDSRSE